jgi:(p)ppGpp synthase/HD superfamily hydrolase
MKPSVTEKSARIAAIAHKEQIRKSGDSPYIVHPFMVALKLVKYNFPETVIAAALLHDVLEDTDYPEDKLREEVGNEVVDIVKSVTNDESLPWEEKKIKYVESVRAGSPEAKVVAVADKIHNLESLLSAHAEQGPDVWKKFNRGKDKKVWYESEVLKMAKETLDHPLVDEYEILIEKVKKLD